MFANAARVSIHNSKLISADTTHNHIHNAPDPLEPLRRYVVGGALFDSTERYDPPKCHPETRVAVLNNIESWAQGKNGPYPILWLRGAAGAGKSAIAQTLSEIWSTRELLAASFFFSRTAAGRNQSKHFVATIVSQLVQTIPMTRRYVEHAISEDWRLFDRSLQHQMLALIVNPLMAPYTGILPNQIIAVDGLDECCVDYPNQDHEAQQREILEVINLLAQYPIPLRFLIASRPERQIRLSFQKDSLTHLVFTITLDGSQNPDADISLFLHCRFLQIKQENPDIEWTWPSDGTIQHLVMKSSGHFVYASTVMRYISNPRTNPKKGLEIILGLSIPDDQLHNPFAQLDALYLLIMASIHPTSLAPALRMLEILTHPDIFGEQEPFKSLSNLSPGFFAKLLFTESEQIYLDLIDLHSILEVPSGSTPHAPIRILHASFGEFLTSRIRSGPYYIDPVQAYLHCKIYVVKHTIIVGAQGRGYRFNDLRAVLMRRLTACPPSKELRSGLHALIGRRERGYITNLESLGMPTVDRLNKPRGKFSWLDQIAILTYLQTCNIEEIEASSMLRWLMSTSLAGQKIRLEALVNARRIGREIYAMISTASLSATLRFLANVKPTTLLIIFVIISSLIVVIVTLKFKLGF